MIIYLIIVIYEILINKAHQIKYVFMVHALACILRGATDSLSVFSNLMYLRYSSSVLENLIHIICLSFVTNQNLELFFIAFLIKCIFRVLQAQRSSQNSLHKVLTKYLGNSYYKLLTKFKRTYLVHVLVKTIKFQLNLHFYLFHVKYYQFVI